MALDLTITEGEAVSTETILSYALTTLNAAKRALNIALTTTTDDTLITQLINNITVQIEKHCSRRFKAADYSDERYDGNGADKLYLRNYPINTVSACTIDNETVSEATDYDDYDGYWIEPVIGGIKLEGCLYRVDKWDSGWQNVKITFNAGYSTIPHDLRQACHLAIREFYNIATKGVKTENLGYYSYTLDMLSENVQEAFYSLINPYQKVGYY